MEVANLTNTGSLAADALLKLRATKTGFEILEVLNWVEGQLNKNS